MRDFITIERKEINDNVLYFASNCTGYISIRKAKVYNPAELLKRCTKLCKQVKELGCKVSHKNKTRLFIKDNMLSYEEEKLEYFHNYDMAKSYALWITSHPLPVGTSENEELNTMYKFSHKVEKACYRDTVFNKVNEFGLKLDEIENAILEDDFNYSKIVF